MKITIKIFLLIPIFQIGHASAQGVDSNTLKPIPYIEQERRESFGIDRPLPIIEKNKEAPGRRKQNELDLDIGGWI